MLRTVFLPLLLASAVFAQSAPEFSHTFVSTQSASLPARDFWFTMPKNYEAQGGKYYQLYVTSRQATTVNIQVQGGTPTKKAIGPQEVFAFMIPLGWEVTTSGIVEDLGIHVWSDDADLTVHLLSRNPATSGGMNIIPVSAWGVEYVVAAYHSIIEGFDYPTEFAIVAADDSTHVTIIPTADIRKTGLKNEVLHKANDTFSVVLNRGEVVQYMATEAQNADDYDFTGTIVTSTKPIGVFGASQCANIPPEYPYCDYVGEMLLPVESWGKTYHSIPFYNRKGGDSFCMIASTDNQTIYFNGVPVSSLNRFEPLFRPDIAEPGTWTSDAPFLLTQYINSTEWPDPVTGQTNNGVGDPAMVVLNPAELYTKELLFQTPIITSGTGFTHYANILVHKDAVTSTTINGIPIASYPSISQLPIPFSQYIMYRARSLKSGSHLVKSDSGVSVYVYGYGSYEAYAWNGSLGQKRLPIVLDTLAPTISSTTGDCFCARIAFSDIHPHKTGIASFVVDSITNIQFTQDPQFSFASDTSFYDICVKEPSKSGYIRVSIYDNAGNRTTVESRINARIAPKVAPVSLALPYAGAGIPTTETFTLQNTTGAPLAIAGPSGLRLVGTGTGFAIELPDPSDIPTDGSREFTVTFAAPDSLVRRDTIVIGNECGTISLPLASYYPGPPAPLANLYNFGCILFGTTKDSMIGIMNPVVDLTIDTMWIDDPTYFKISPLQFPFTLEKGTWFYIHVTYYADKLDTARSTLRVVTIEQGESHTTLQGCAVTAGTVRTEISYSEADLRSSLERGNTFAWLAPSPNPAERLSSISFTFGLSERQSVGLELFDLLGKQVAAIPQQQFEGGVHELSLQTNSLVSGAYIYRYLVNGIPYSGMMTIR